MLREDEIAQALHARRLVALPPLNPHGPLGLEQLAKVVAQIQYAKSEPTENVQRPISLSVETWERLDELARAARPANGPPLTASALAAVLLEQAVTGK